MYELWWIRYFRSERKLSDFYSSFLGVPLAGATLPVISFFLLGVYGKNIWLLGAVIILGIGHIGIHIQHSKEIKISSWKERNKTEKIFKKRWKLLWSSIFVTLRPDFCYRVIYPRNKPHIFIYQRFILERLISYFQFAVPFPFLSVNFTAACFFLVSCVAIFMRNTSFAANSLYHILKLLLFYWVLSF